MIFDCQTIITGVRRASRDATISSGGAYKAEAQPRAAEDKPDYTSHLKTYGTKPPPPLPKPEPKVEAPPDPQRVRSEVRQCKNDDGEVVEGYYDVRGGEVYVWTVENGARPLGHGPCRPGDDPAVVARRILREKVGRGGFWNRLH